MQLNAEFSKPPFMCQLSSTGRIKADGKCILEQSGLETVKPTSCETVVFLNVRYNC